MPYKGRALYNLLVMNLKGSPTLVAERWQVENYRQWEEETLLKQLESYSIFLNRETFLVEAKEVDSPEELTDRLYTGEEFTEHEQIFLCLFELWRRFLPHKISTSIFCDELDYLIEKYEEGDLSYEEELESALLKWETILEDHIDKGGDPKEAFAIFSEFSCHNLEVFIYEYISHQIDLENDLSASELLDGFYNATQKPLWFDFLRLRLVFDVDPEEGRVMMERLFDALEENLDIHLLFEVLHFLICIGEFERFIPIFSRAFTQLTCESDLHELMMIGSDYMNCIERFSDEKVLNDLLEKRKNYLPTQKLDEEDEAIQKLKQLIILAPVPPKEFLREGQ